MKETITPDGYRDSIEVQICISEDGRPTPIESLVASVKKLQIEARLLERILEAMDENTVNSYCGEKYSRRTSEERFRRAGTLEKMIVTSVGLKLNKVRDQNLSETNDFPASHKVFKNRIEVLISNQTTGRALL